MQVDPLVNENIYLCVSLSVTVCLSFSVSHCECLGLTVCFCVCVYKSVRLDFIATHTREIRNWREDMKIFNQRSAKGRIQGALTDHAIYSPWGGKQGRSAVRSWTMGDTGGEEGILLTHQTSRIKNKLKKNTSGTDLTPAHQLITCWSCLISNIRSHVYGQPHTHTHNHTHIYIS